MPWIQEFFMSEEGVVSQVRVLVVIHLVSFVKLS